MDLHIEFDEDLLNHKQKCRCCMKRLDDDKNLKGIDEPIQTYFYELTQISLVDSQELSHHICQSCYKELLKFHQLRMILIEKQSKLYDFVRKKILDPEEVQTNIKVEIEEMNEEVYIDHEPEEFNSFKQESREKKRVKSKSTYYCDLCEFSATAKKILEPHLRGHFGRRKYSKEHQDYYCEQCGMKFDKKFHLNAHLRAKHTEKVRSHICGICEKAFYSTENLKKHVESHNQKQLPCEYCGKLFSCINNLRTHLYYHADPKFICTYEGCDKKFFMRKRLRAHLKAHTNQKDFLCSFCEKCYYSQNDLNRHIFSIHQKLRFFCEVFGCQGSFSRREYYKKHAVTHHQNLGPDELENLLHKIKEAVPIQK